MWSIPDQLGSGCPRLRRIKAAGPCPSQGHGRNGGHLRAGRAPPTASRFSGRAACRRAGATSSWPRPDAFTHTAIAARSAAGRGSGNRGHCRICHRRFRSRRPRRRLAVGLPVYCAGLTAEFGGPQRSRARFGLPDRSSAGGVAGGSGDILVGDRDGVVGQCRSNRRRRCSRNRRAGCAGGRGEPRSEGRASLEIPNLSERAPTNSDREFGKSSQENVARPSKSSWFRALRARNILLLPPRVTHLPSGRNLVDAFRSRSGNDFRRVAT